MSSPKLYEKSIRVSVPGWMHEELMAEAKRRGINMSTLVRQVLALELHRKERTDA